MKAFYECGVQDTETQLAEEVAAVCRDYCTQSWAVALDRVGVSANFQLMRAENIFFPEDIREVPNTVPPLE